MNETLTVRDFGPIKDATVVFKRVTVFIGPTGGGKSTLAKLAAVFRNEKMSFGGKDKRHFFSQTEDFGLDEFENDAAYVDWVSARISATYSKNSFLGSGPPVPSPTQIIGTDKEFIARHLMAVAHASGQLHLSESEKAGATQQALELYDEEYNKILRSFSPTVLYIPADRLFLAAISGALAGLSARKIALPFVLLEFASDFEVAREETPSYPVDLFNVSYLYKNGQNFITLPNGQDIKLANTASGIQSALPLLLVADYAAKQPRTTHFIIEEPELNLFPEAQQALLQTLIEKCTQGDNDLIITTHSPYVLTVLNTLMYAHKVAHEVPENAKKVEKLIPRKYWIDPAQFAAYYVDLPTTRKKQQVRSIVDKKTGMIGENELDHLSFTLADLLGNLLDLRTPPQPKAKAATAAK